ncbi:MAG: sigma-70 family RNA polymerase sigma factor [Anaerolineae bacterium]|nr:sigma-70 family RNA polymerase sigma factor [Anaerolineae bacterium]
MDEIALIVAAKKGELRAFNQLVLQYQGMAYNLAYRVLGDSDAAADVTQDSFVKAFKSLRQYRGGSFKAWVLRIVTNTCYDYLRAKQRRPSSSLDDLAEDPDRAEELTHHGEGPEEYVMRRELSVTIQTGIALLPADQRIALVLSDVEGMSYQEIAEVTESELGTVKSRLSRARAKLRDYLQARPELLPARYRLNDSRMGS